MKFGNVSACLGSQVSGEQIAQIKPILKKLGDKEGILHLETYSENNTTIYFEMKEISQENYEKLREILLIFYTKSILYTIYSKLSSSHLLYQWDV